MSKGWSVPAAMSATGERTTWRNGHRDRVLDTRLGSLQLRIPKLRQGSYFPPFLEARKVSEKALIAVIQEAWIGGVSTRRVDELVQAMGLSGISKSQVSKLCKDIDERVHVFLDRPLTGEWPSLWLDATYLKQREGGRIVSVAAIIACMGPIAVKRILLRYSTGGLGWLRRAWNSFYGVSCAVQRHSFDVRYGDRGSLRGPYMPLCHYSRRKIVWPTG